MFPVKELSSKLSLKVKSAIANTRSFISWGLAPVAEREGFAFPGKVLKIRGLIFYYLPIYRQWFRSGKSPETLQLQTKAVPKFVPRYAPTPNRKQRHSFCCPSERKAYKDLP